MSKIHALPNTSSLITVNGEFICALLKLNYKEEVRKGEVAYE